MQDFGRRLKDCMQMRGYDNKALSKEIGVAPTTISSWVTGRTEPDVTNLRAVARVLNVSYELLLCEWEMDSTAKCCTNCKWWYKNRCNQFRRCTINSGFERK